MEIYIKILLFLAINKTFLQKYIIYIFFEKSIYL